MRLPIYVMIMALGSPALAVPKKRWKYATGAGVLMVRAAGVKTGNFSKAFTDNGFQKPKSVAISWGGLGYFMSPSGWRFGGGGAGWGATQRSGSSEADFSLGYGGIYFAKDLMRASATDLTLGALVGGGGADVSVLSATQNGVTDESLFVVEPMLTMAFPLGRTLKLAVAASAFLPLGGSIEEKGDSLGIARIASPTWTAGIHLIFGGIAASGPGTSSETEAGSLAQN